MIACEGSTVIALKNSYPHIAHNMKTSLIEKDDIVFVVAIWFDHKPHNHNRWTLLRGDGILYYWYGTQELFDNNFVILNDKEC